MTFRIEYTNDRQKASNPNVGEWPSLPARFISRGAALREVRRLRKRGWRDTFRIRRASQEG